MSQGLKGQSIEIRIILQYVDNILIPSSTYEDCLLNTITVLNYLAKRGYKVLAHKTQICKQDVEYLGFRLKQGTRSLRANRKQTIGVLAKMEA